MFSFLFVFLVVFHFDVLERYDIFFSCPKSLSLLFWVSFFLFFFSVTALFYLEDSRKAHLQGVRARRSEDTKRRAPHRVGDSERERERESSLAPLFICFFFPPPWACPMQIRLRQERCSTWRPYSSPWTFLCSIFTGFSRPCLLATAILGFCLLWFFFFFF